MECLILLFVITIIAVTSTFPEYNEHIFYQLALKKGQKPKFICEINQDANYLMKNHIRWERIATDSKRERLSRLGNVINGLETNYSVFIQSTNSGVQFHLQFLQELDEDFGFLQCVLYNSNHEILQLKQVLLGDFADITYAKVVEQEKTETNVLESTKEKMDDSSLEENRNDLLIKTQIILDRSDLAYGPVTKAVGHPPIFTKQLMPLVNIHKNPTHLHVHFFAYPPPVVSWYIHCSSIKPIRLFDAITITNRSSLAISTIQLEFAGCSLFVRIQNMFGANESKAVLLVQRERRNSPETIKVTFKLENYPTIGKSVIMTCNTNSGPGHWLIYKCLQDSNELIFLDEAITSEYSLAKYNLTITRWDTITFVIQNYSLEDKTVYICVYTDDFRENSYEEQIDLRNYSHSNEKGSSSTDKVKFIVTVCGTCVLILGIIVHVLL